MFRNLFLMLLPLALLLAGCGDDDPINGDLSLGFRATWGGAPLVMNDVLTYENGKQFKFDRFSFYVSEVTLLGGPDGDRVITDVDMVNLSAATTTSEAVAGVRLANVSIPVGVYSGIRLGLGLTGSQNAMKPAQFAQGHPLSAPGEYWDGWQSYIFAKVEGRVSSNNDGIFNFGFAYHTGSDEVFRTMSVTIPVTVDAGGVASLVGTVDVKKLLAGIDLTDQTGGHTIGDIGLATILMDNFRSSALTFE